MNEIRKNAKRDAAIYDAWVKLNGHNTALDTGFGTFLAKRYGVSKQRIQQIIAEERKRRQLDQRG